MATKERDASASQPQHATLAAQDDATELNHATATTAVSVASDASDAPPPAISALANSLEYTLTVGQARALFEQHNRKVPAERTLQNYCGEGTIAAQKIRTTYGSEWLVNDESLLKFIRTQPVLTTATPASHATHELNKPLNHATASTPASDASAASCPHRVIPSSRYD